MKYIRSDKNKKLNYGYTIIKFISFEPLYYDINMDIVLSFMIFNDLISLFLSIYC